MAAPSHLLTGATLLITFMFSTARLPIGVAQGLDERAQLAPYRAIVEAYRAGRTTAALAQLQTLGSKTLQLVADAARIADAKASTAVLDRPLLPAAAMLHTDAVQFLWTDRRAEALRHMDIARRWIDASERTPLPSGSFRRRWYLAAGLLLVEEGLEQGGIDPALAHFALACRALPDDVPVLTAAAWLDERTALAAAPRGKPDVVRQKVLYLRQAASRLEAALVVDPLAAEAALRLGRVHMLLGDSAGARKQLAPLVDRATMAPPDAYLARLFLGRLFEQDEDVAKAEALYREAAERVPSGQAARMAIAHLRYRAGDVARSADALDSILTVATESNLAVPEDPWTHYLNGRLQQGSMLRDDLRREAQR